MPGEVPTAGSSRQRQDRNRKDAAHDSDADSTDSEKTIRNTHIEDIKHEPVSDDELSVISQLPFTFAKPPLQHIPAPPRTTVFSEEENRKRYLNQTHNEEDSAKKKRSDVATPSPHNNTGEVRKAALNGRQQVREKRPSVEERKDAPSRQDKHQKIISKSKPQSSPAKVQQSKPGNNTNTLQSNRPQQSSSTVNWQVAIVANSAQKVNALSKVLTQKSTSSPSKVIHNTISSATPINMTQKPTQSPQKRQQQNSSNLQQPILNPVINHPSMLMRTSLGHISSPTALMGILPQPSSRNSSSIAARQVNPTNIPNKTPEQSLAPRNTTPALPSTRRVQPSASRPSSSHEATQTEEIPLVQRVAVDPVWRMTHTMKEHQYRFVLQNHLFSDITFMLGQQLMPIHCHKFPLAIASQIFEDMIYGSAQQQPMVPPIHLPDIDPQIFNLILQFVYTNLVDISDFNDACNLMQAAHKFELLELTEKCRVYLWLHINHKTIWKTLEFSRGFKDKQLISSVLGVVKLNAETLLHSTYEFESTSTRVVVNSLLTHNLKGQLHIDSEATLLDACVRWCQAEVKRQASELNPPTLQDIFSPMKDKFHFLKFTPKEFTESVIHTQILPADEALAILSELIIPSLNTSNIHPLPQYVIKTCPKPVVDSIQLIIYGVKKSYVTSIGGLIDGSLQSVHDLISTMKLNVGRGDVLLGVRLITQVLNLGGFSYDEKLTVFVNDVESGENIFSTTVKQQLQSNSIFDVSFDGGIVFADLAKFATRQMSEIELKIVPHKAGKYTFTNNRGKVCTGLFKGKTDCQLRYPPRHNFIVCAAFKNES